MPFKTKYGDGWICPNCKSSDTLTYSIDADGVRCLACVGGWRVPYVAMWNDGYAEGLQSAQKLLTNASDFCSRDSGKT